MDILVSRLDQAIEDLRALCNREITIANQAAYRTRPGGPIINPSVPFERVNNMLKACDAVFAAHGAKS